MSNDTNIYVGWYVRFTKSSRKIVSGIKKVRRCPNGKRHPSQFEFCPTCGAKILEDEVNSYNHFAHPFHIQDETDAEELKYMTLGMTTLDDLKKLGRYHAVFPEFMGEDGKVIVMCGDYKEIEDIRRSNGFVMNLDVMDKPSAEWIELLKKAFDFQEFEMAYGIVSEVV